MLNCLIIKDNEITTINIKNISEDNIFKKCGYKSNNNFKKIFVHKLKDNIKLELWGKTVGLDKYLNVNKFLLEKNFKIYNKCILIALNNKNEYISCLKEYYDVIINNNEILNELNYEKKEDLDETKDKTKTKTKDEDEDKDKDKTKDDLIEYNEEIIYEDLSELTEDSYIYSSDEEEK
tara:strand:+ start:76 stop:609 length:534 start_codon:yes stop_codon:yes gene_type:complete